MIVMTRCKICMIVERCSPGTLTRTWLWCEATFSKSIRFLLITVDLVATPYLAHALWPRSSITRLKQFLYLVLSSHFLVIIFWSHPSIFQNLTLSPKRDCDFLGTNYTSISLSPESEIFFKKMIQNWMCIAPMKSKI